MATDQPETTVRARYYPGMPPLLDGETGEEYTDRLTGADRTDRRPYDHARNRQCSIGYHDQCSDPAGDTCGCPCHTTPPGEPRHDDPRVFVLARDEDITGVSGTGPVAQGVEFADGTCAMRWLTEHASTAIYEDVETLQIIHGHGGKTRIVWIEAPR